MSTKLFSPETPESRHHPLRSPSVSSDVTTRSVYNSVPSAQPAPAYVGNTAACDLLVEELQQPVLVSRAALSLVNEFLDQVLYNILLTSRSTSLSALKAAVPTVLKPRLGKAALRVAEQELEEYINEDEELELQSRRSGVDLKHDFDSDLAWRLARLRCMVYTRLGDLEEEDEEEWLENEGLRAQLQSIRLNARSNVETGPASAIFLTSIIEYLGEQALYYAAQHAQKRHHQHGNQQIREEEIEFADLPAEYNELVVGGRDMNHVGRDSPLSRLWRSYRRNTRDSTSRPLSPELRNNRGLGLSHSRTPSSVPYETVIIEEECSPAQIPLPMTGNDVDQIEIPGLAPLYSDDEDDAEVSEEDVVVKRRPASMINFPGSFSEDLGRDNAEVPEIPEKSPLRPTWLRKRSISTPVTTLSKIEASRKASAAKADAFLKDGASIRPSLHKDHHSEDSAEAEFGGAVAFVAGALGSGVLGVPDERPYQPVTTNSLLPGDDFANIRSVPSTRPKQTVAEEMLGSTPSVAHPVDAKTGASITDITDFRGMHVPSVTLPVNPADLTPRAENTNPMTAAGSRNMAQELFRPTPSRTISGKEVTARPDITATVHDATTKSSFEILENRSNISNIAPVNTVSTLDSQVKPEKQDAYSSADASHSRNSSTASRLLGTANDAISRPQTLPQPRTTGGANDEAKQPHSPSAFSVIRDTRPGTGHSSMSKRFHGKPLQVGDDSDEAKKRSLEILIRGNETLHYTLTPAAAMRDDVSSQGNIKTQVLTIKQQAMGQKIRTPNQDMAEFLRNTGPRTDELTSRANPNGLSSNVSEPPSSPMRLVQRMVSSSSAKGPTLPVSPTRSINPMGEPRDARADPVTNTRDLANYARSTGPSTVKQLPLALPADAIKPTSPPRVGAGRQEVASPTSTIKPISRLKYQARDARTSQAGDTSDLIDFIREGPANPGKEHRIDRRVAPFRTTMDSEDFDNLGQGQGVASLRESEDDPHASSADPSVTSQTRLINTNGRTSRNQFSAGSTDRDAAESDVMPKRTRRRIKDPYAVYDSDDDDLEDELGGRGNRNQEESLIDFLNNTEPPSAMKLEPVPSGRTSYRTADQFITNGPREASPHLTQSGSKMDKYRPTQPTHAAHVDRNRATLSSNGLTNNRRNSSKPRFEARDAKATSTTTFELAEYLKNSGPPPNAQYQPQPFMLSISSSQQAKLQPATTTTTSAPKAEKGIFKRFSRSKR